MSLSTLLCFQLCAYVLVKGKPSTKSDTVIFSIVGSSLAAIGAVALFGYLVDLPAAYRWANGIPMAVQAALGFAILGVGILTWTKVSGGEIGDEYRSPLALQLGVGMLSATLLLWQATVGPG